MRTDEAWYLDRVVTSALSVARPRKQLWLAAVERAESADLTRAAVEIARQQGLVLTHAQACAAGLTSADVRRLVRRGTWTAPRSGVLCVVPRRVAPEDEVHGHCAEVLATAAALSRPGTVITHESGAVLHELPLVARLTRPTLTQAWNGEGRRDVLVHAAPMTKNEIETWFGAPVSTPARTVVDVARSSGARAGIAAADGALRAGITSREALRDAVIRETRWPNVTVARRVIELASPLAESALESVSRLLIHDAGLPMPELQVVIATAGGTYRVDGLWRAQRVVLEVDGMLKYQTPADLRAEKLRQENLERAGYRVVRITWDDVFNRPAETLARVAAALRAGRATHGAG